MLQAGLWSSSVSLSFFSNVLPEYNPGTDARLTAGCVCYEKLVGNQRTDPQRHDVKVPAGAFLLNT
jgi:hypothetical protein